MLKDKQIPIKLKQPKRFVQLLCLNVFLVNLPYNQLLANTGQVNVQAHTDVQTNKVTGTVKDHTGEPVIGASVVVDGTSEGTITDIDGNFLLQVPVGKKITISYIGYKPQTISPKPRENVNITLQENTKVLDEVVVVGYGTQNAKNVTGSITQIKSENFSQLAVSNLAEALVGQVNGLNVSGGTGRPGDGATLSIRQSFNYSKDGGSNIPLVIIDDVIQVDPNTGNPSMTQFNMLDASEVESITVLRDGSAAIYGSRASQGAIIVKTKRGQNSAPKISYSGKFTFNDAISHSKTLNAYEYGVWANSVLKASGKALSGGQPDMKKLYSDQELEAMKGLNYDWLNEAWSSAFAMTHALNVSGGNDRATYYAGGSYYDQGANLGNQDFSKWTYRAGVDVKLTSDLKFNASVSGNHSEQHKTFTKNASNMNAYGSAAGEQGDYNLLRHMPKYIPWQVTLDDGNTYFTSPSLGPHQLSGNAASANQAGSWNYFSMLNNGSGQTSKDNGFAANFSMSYAIPYVKGLSVKATYATSRAVSDDEQVQMPFTLALMKKNVQTPDGHLYEAHPSVQDYEIKLNDKSSRVVYSDVITASQQMNFYVNYDRSFGKHDVSAMATMERTDAEFSRKNYLYENPNMPYLGTNTTAGILNPGNSYTARSESGTLSYIGRASYNYDSRYLFQFFFRTDASTKFAPENYWGFFPGVSLGWIASEETWFKGVTTWFDYLKVRASWGQTGKDNIKAWAWMQTYDHGADKGFQFGSAGGELGPGLTPGKTANRLIHWDRTTKWNVGLDMRFLNGRLGTNIDVYYDRNADILNQYMGQITGTPVSVGGLFAEENFGTIDAYGTEISLSWRDKIREVSYNINVDFGFNGNKVKEWPLLPNTYPSYNQIKEGESTFFPNWGYKVWRGTSSGDGMLRTQQDIDNYWNYLSERAVATGNTPKFFNITDKAKLRPGMLAYQDLHGALDSEGNLGAPNGQIADKEDFAKLSKTNKTYGFNTRLGFNWKGLSFNTQIATSWGGIRTLHNYKINTSSNQMLWSPESYWRDMFDENLNPNGRYPNMGYNGDANIIADSDFWTTNTFRCYIRNMSLGYSLPSKWIKPAKLEAVAISITGNNLWDFYNPYPGHYTNMYDSSLTPYPTLRSWTVGVNLSF